MPINTSALPASPDPASPDQKQGVGVSGTFPGKKAKTIIFDNLHQYHLHFFPRMGLLPAPRLSLYARFLCLQETAGKLNKPIVGSIDLIWGPENSADNTVLNY